MPQTMLYYLEFEHLLNGVTTSKEEDAMISSGKTSTKPATPPPDSHLITAQVEGSTLTTAQYNCIFGLTCSLLHVSTSDLVYDGHTVNPLTLHWHCPATVEIYNSFFLCAEMALEGIKSVHVDFMPVFDALGENVRTKNLYYVVHINGVCYSQEIRLITAAWDGDLLALTHSLESWVPIDIRIPVSVVPCSPS